MLSILTVESCEDAGALPKIELRMKVWQRGDVLVDEGVGGGYDDQKLAALPRLDGRDGARRERSLV